MGFRFANHRLPEGGLIFFYTPPTATTIMGHSYSSLFCHCVFSTKERRRFITPQLQEQLWPYLGGIAHTNEMKALAVGGTDNHAHLLLSLPATLTVAHAIQIIKSSSTHWIHETFPEHRLFQWQEGYGAFSIGVSGIEPTMNYILRQAEHHEQRSYENEFLAFLRKHNLDYEHPYVLD